MKAEKWLIVSYFANLPTSAASHHIDDRLIELQNEKIDITVLSSFLGLTNKKFKHIYIPSIFPAGIKYEIRHIIRQRIQNKLLATLIKIVMLLLILPFYLIEKLFIRFEAYWSWFITASIAGIIWTLKNKPKIIYSTGGASSAHLATLIISKITNTPFISEFQDPLVFQYPKNKPLEYRYNQWLEKKLSDKALLLIFLTKNAKESAKNRLYRKDNLTYIYSGSFIKKFTNKKKGNKIIFSHIGSLGGSRNLKSLLKAFETLCKKDNKYINKFEIILIGHCQKKVKKQIINFKYKKQIINLDKSPRNKAYQKIEESDVLLLIQDTNDISIETIPSKIFEYLMSNRLILGLVHKNDELKNILKDSGHYAIEILDINSIVNGLKQILDGADKKIKTPDFSVKKSVKKLVSQTRAKL